MPVLADAEQVRALWRSGLTLQQRRVQQQRLRRLPGDQVGRYQPADAGEVRAGQSGTQQHPPLTGFLVPEHERIAEVSRMVDGAVRPEAVIAVLVPRHQIGAGGVADHLGAVGIGRVVAGVEDMERSVVLDDAAGEHVPPIRAMRVVRIPIQGGRQLVPVHEVAGDDVVPRHPAFGVAADVEDVVFAVVVERDGVAQPAARGTEVQRRAGIGSDRDAARVGSHQALAAVTLTGTPAASVMVRRCPSTACSGAGPRPSPLRL